MNWKISILFCILVFFAPINTSSYRRFRRQINNHQSIHSKTPSGSIGGTSYYGNLWQWSFDQYSLSFFHLHVGIAADPNSGSFISRPNRPGGSGSIPISYDSHSEYYRYLIHPNHPNQQPNYWYNRNNAWQNLYTTHNQPIHQYYNRYEPGNQGWYLTGNDYRFNAGQSFVVQPCLLVLTITFLAFCK